MLQWGRMKNLCPYLFFFFSMSGNERQRDPNFSALIVIFINSFYGYFQFNRPFSTGYGSKSSFTF